MQLQIAIPATSSLLRIHYAALARTANPAFISAIMSRPWRRRRISASPFVVVVVIEEVPASTAVVVVVSAVVTVCRAGKAATTNPLGLGLVAKVLSDRYLWCAG